MVSSTALRNLTSHCRQSKTIHTVNNSFSLYSKQRGASAAKTISGGSSPYQNVSLFFRSFSSSSSSSSLYDSNLLQENSNLHSKTGTVVSSNRNTPTRLSKLISQNSPVSRREAERLILGGHVKLAGTILTSPATLILPHQVKNGALTVNGKALQINNTNHNNNTLTGTKGAQQQQQQQQQQPRVWLVHKLAGELVTESDPHNRPNVMDRLKKSGVGKSKGNNNNSSVHLKPIGRLDMNTEGLLLVTDNGQYAHDMESPAHQLHRTYRVRAHGLLTDWKMDRIQRGITIDGLHYKPMKVAVDEPKQRRRRPTGTTNTWLEITCCEGKNRQVRKVLKEVGLTVTRLIRVSYGDYRLQTIPPGMAIEVPCKAVENQKRKGPLFARHKEPKQQQQIIEEEPRSSPIQWIRNL